MMRFIKSICVLVLLALVGAGAADAALGEKTKAQLKAEGIRLLNLEEKGYRTNDPVPFGIAVKDGYAVGVVFTPRRDNPPDKAGKMLRFKLKIEADGTFGSTDRDFSRFWLRNHKSGDPKY